MVHAFTPLTWIVPQNATSVTLTHLVADCVGKNGRPVRVHGRLSLVALSGSISRDRVRASKGTGRPLYRQGPVCYNAAREQQKGQRRPM